MPEEPPVILLISRDAPLLHSLGESLEKAGCEVRVAADGDAGLAIACQLVPHAVILDSELSPLAGIPVWEIFARQKLGPALLLYPEADGDAAAQALALGFAACIPKPADTDKVLSLVTRIVREYQPEGACPDAESGEGEGEDCRDRSSLAVLGDFIQLLYASLWSAESGLIAKIRRYDAKTQRDDPEAQSDRAMVSDAIEALSRLSENALSAVSALDGDGSALKRPVRVAALFESLAKVLASELHGKAIDLQLRREGHDLAAGELDLVSEVLASILQFTITISRRMSPVTASISGDDSNVRLVIELWPSNPKSELIAELFEPGTDSLRGGLRGMKQTALGLARDIARMLGGDLAVTEATGSLLAIRLTLQAFPRQKGVKITLGLGNQ